MYHRQRSAGNTEHHAGEESGHIHAQAPGHVSGGVSGPEVGEIADADRVKPEYVVQRVMQAGRDQQTVQEGIDAGSHSVHSHDRFASFTSAPNTIGHRKSRTAEAMMDTPAVMMATQRFPEKNESQSGSFVFLNLL